jgi:hypothetical protein
MKLSDMLTAATKLSLYVELVGGDLNVHDVGKLLQLLADRGKVAVVVRPNTGLTLVLDVPTPEDYEPIHLETGERVQSYGAYFREVVGGPPEKRVFYYEQNNGGKVKEVEPAELLA